VSLTRPASCSQSRFGVPVAPVEDLAGAWTPELASPSGPVMREWRLFPGGGPAALVCTAVADDGRGAGPAGWGGGCRAGYCPSDGVPVGAPGQDRQRGAGRDVGVRAGAAGAAEAEWTGVVECSPNFVVATPAISVGMLNAGAPPASGWVAAYWRHEPQRNHGTHQTLIISVRSRLGGQNLRSWPSGRADADSLARGDQGTGQGGSRARAVASGRHCGVAAPTLPGLRPDLYRNRHH
jgi:hypothetical protein